MPAVELFVLPIEVLSSEPSLWLSLQRQSVRQLLAHIYSYPVTLEHTDEGAPFLPDFPNHWISISHTPQAVVVARSSEGPIGVDIETKRDKAAMLIERYATIDEIMLLQGKGLPPIALWTAKEAIYKMTRGGLEDFRYSIRLLSIGRDRLLYFELSGECPSAYVSLIDDGNAMIAIATETKPLQLVPPTYIDHL